MAELSQPLADILSLAISERGLQGEEDRNDLQSIAPTVCIVAQENIVHIPELCATARKKCYMRGKYKNLKVPKCRRSPVMCSSEGGLCHLNQDRRSVSCP